MARLLLKDFSGGINTRYSARRIGDGETPESRNARFQLTGALSKRLGTTRYAVSASGLSTICSLFSYLPVAGATASTVLISDGDQIERTSSISGGTWTNVKTGLTATFAPEFILLNNKVYVVNGTNASFSINSSYATNNVSGYPVARFHVLHKGYVFTLNQPGTDYSLLQWSNYNDAETWTATDKESIHPQDGNFGAGIISYGDELIIWKSPFGSDGVCVDYSQSSMYRVLGDVFDAQNPTYVIERIPMDPGVGLLGHRSARIQNGVLVFATNNGVYAYGGGGQKPKNISEALRSEVDDWDTSTQQHYSRQPAATVYQDKYYLSIYSTQDTPTTSQQRVYVLDENGKWWMDLLGTSDDFSAGSSTGGDWMVNNGLLYSPSSLVAARLRQWETDGVWSDETDSGGAQGVNFSYKTKEFNFDRPVVFKNCYVHLKRQSAGNLKFYINVDQAGEVASPDATGIDMTTPDSGTTQITPTVLRKCVNIGKAGQTIQFRFYDESTNDVEIYAIELIYEDIPGND